MQVNFSAKFFSYWPMVLLRKPHMQQFIKFCLVGAANTAVDFTIYIALTRFIPFFGAHILTANAISFTVAVSNSYVLNRRWTFRDTHSVAVIQFPKFILSNLVALGINELILYALVHSAEVNDILAKACAISISLFWNFFINKYLIFRAPSTAKPDTE
jgi:putative flippase GtrA